MFCECATHKPVEERWNCLVSEDDYMFLVPDSNLCAEIYGEGLDAEINQKRCEDCAKFYWENEKRCCKDEPLTLINGEIKKSKYIADDVRACGGFERKTCFNCHYLLEDKSVNHAECNNENIDDNTALENITNGNTTCNHYEPKT